MSIAIEATRHGEARRDARKTRKTSPALVSFTPARAAQTLLAVAALMLSASAKADNSTCLPFDMPSADSVLNSSKKVFAHYFYPLPISIDNQPAPKDYYTVNYLSPSGENNKFLSAGGLLRSRPLPVTPSASSYRLTNMKREVTLAIARGLNGFAFDTMATSDATSGGSLALMLQAAKAVDSRFKIMLMPDMAGLGYDTSKVMTIVKAVYNDSSLYRLSDGRLVVSPFAAEQVTPAAWASMTATLKSQGYNIAFIPNLASLAAPYVNQYAPVSVGLGNFGAPGVPDQLDWIVGNAPRVRASSAPIFFAGLSPQGYKPQSGMYYEAYNSLAYRNAWAGIIKTNPDMVQVVSWNDYGESTHISPAVSAAGDAGNGFYNLTGYYTTWWRNGSAPAITRNAVYYFYRREPVAASAPKQTVSSYNPLSQAAQDKIEVVVFAKTASLLITRIGGVGVRTAVPAGMSSYTFALQPGYPGMDLFSADGSKHLVAVSNRSQIYSAAAGLPDGVRDLTYWSGGATDAGSCSITLN